MKKLLLAMLCLIVAVSAVSCRPNNAADYVPPKSERYTDPDEDTEETDSTEETEKVTEQKVQIKHKTVSGSSNNAKTPTEPTQAPTAAKKASSKTKATEPPTQGATRAGTDINVHIEKGTFEKSDLVFVYDGANIELDDEIDDAVAILGEEDAVDEFSKTRTEYDFGDITVVSYKRGDVEKVEKITINSEDISTPKNAVIGMYATQLRRIYGDPTRATSSAYVYTIGNKSLIFYHEDNIVNEITYKLTL